MEVSEIKVFLVKGNSKLKAKAHVTVRTENGWELTLKGLRIHDDGIKAPWVGVPTERYSKNGKDEYTEMLWINQTAQSDLYPKVLFAYKEKIRTA